MNTAYEAEVLALRHLGADLIESDDIGDYAIEMAVRGWRVFPLRGKIPAIPNPHPQGSFERQNCKGECNLEGHGVLDATSSVDRVAAWWSGRYAGANIGLRPADNVFVIDTDPRNGGAESVQMLIEKYGALPETLTSYSGRGDGGSHRYYRRPFGKLTSKLLGAGIDVKTSAGYLVAPPSIHPDSGRPYSWASETPIADPPEWLVDLVRPVPKSPTETTQIQKDPFWSQFRSAGSSLADDYCTAVSWADLLGRHRWTCLDPDGEADGARWLHPAATSACSATVRHGCLFVYSDNTEFDPTEAGAPHGYTKFRALAVLEHGGDLSAAARALRTTGEV